MKIVLNIISYVLNVVLIIILVQMCHGGSSNPGSDKLQGIRDGILERERADIPMKIQQFDHVYDIAIDSFVFTNNIEPYSGYLVTTWDIDEKQNLTTSQWAANGYQDKYTRKQKTVYVEVTNITTRGRSINWNNNWPAAYWDVQDAN